MVLAAGLGLEVREADAEALSGATEPGAARSQGVCLEAGPLPELTLDELDSLPAASPRWVVALDGVQDPQNLGAIARVADAAGALALLLPARRAAPLSPAVSRASAGALEHLPVARAPNLVRALETLKGRGFWIFGADPEEGVDLFAAAERLLEGDLVLVLGGEGKGLRPGVRAALDAALRIPMGGRVGSLNVATAGAVLLFEWRRRARAREARVHAPPAGRAAED